ncbi:unnamed protein product [Prorocentrum cordatum]|uniref:Uncharacterized protein n=1 Tax=Prorocentrum cordatum TaxID=2364126 RepID=A0ABN9UKX4_9DINO|nr:unnamed protein product [Polarella glacialis]
MAMETRAAGMGWVQGSSLSRKRIRELAHDIEKEAGLHLRHVKSRRYHLVAEKDHSPHPRPARSPRPSKGEKVKRSALFPPGSHQKDKKGLGDSAHKKEKKDQKQHPPGEALPQLEKAKSHEEKESSHPQELLGPLEVQPCSSTSGTRRRRWTKMVLFLLW